MKKFFRTVHKWLSIPVGLIISITCLTGSILVFQDEILETVNPNHYFVEETNSPPITLDKLIPLVNQQLTDNSVANVKIPSDPQRTYTMSLSEGFRVSAFVNPYTGKITGYYNFRESPFFTIMSLHRWLLDGSRTVGKYAVGISTLLFVFILISGFVLWFPREFKKSRFKIQMKKGKRRLFFDLHNVLGAYACLILLICALSGMMWSFDWYRNGIFTIFGAEIPKENHTHGNRNQANKGKKKQKEEANTAVWEIVVKNLARKNPNNEYIRIEDGKAIIHLNNMITSRAADEYIFDKKSGEITKVTLYAEQETTSKIWGWIYSLHVGNYWGIWSKILTFLASLIGASLPITGYYLWWKKAKRSKSVNK